MRAVNHGMTSKTLTKDGATIGHPVPLCMGAKGVQGRAGMTIRDQDRGDCLQTLPQGENNIHFQEVYRISIVSLGIMPIYCHIKNCTYIHIPMYSDIQFHSP